MAPSNLLGGLGVRAEDPVPDINKDPDPGLDLETNPGSARGPFSVVQVFIIILQGGLGTRAAEPVPGLERNSDPALERDRDSDPARGPSRTRTAATSRKPCS